MSTKLTKKQNEIRLRGLRILARIIVRAHLASLREAEDRRNGSGPAHPESPGGKPAPDARQANLRKEDGSAG